MLKLKRRIFKKPIPFTRLIPNFITLIGLIVGISSIRFALDNKWEIAVYCILVASILDGIDGRVARILGATSPFGAELDSICDFANFGVSPAIIIYLWSFQQYEYKLLSWGCNVLFITCMAIRLARFNTTTFLSKENNNISSKYFSTGVPAPSGALLALIPIILDFELAPKFGWNVRSNTIIIDIYVFIIALLLASRFPTFLFKNIHIKPQYLSLCMIISALLIIGVVVYPWYSIPFIAVIYILSIPLCVMIDKRLRTIPNIITNTNLNHIDNSANFMNDE